MSSQPRENPPSFNTPDALLSRLRDQLRRNDSVVFLVGAPLSGPVRSGERGVPMVAGMVELIRAQYHDPDDLSDFQTALQADGNPYQIAFEHLIQRRGPDAANQVVRSAVLHAHNDPPTSLPRRLGQELDQRCADLESQLHAWHLPPACEALGQLAARVPSVFGSCILTTNFDPLLQIAVRRAGGKAFRTVLAHDGDHTQTEGEGCHIVHLHGFWSRSDTLHTPAQLTRPRPKLRRSLERLIAGRPIVALACGGWDDVFNAALSEVLGDDSHHPDVLWTFYEQDPSRIRERHASLLAKLAPGLDSARVNLYSGVDVHTFLPRLVEMLTDSASPSPPTPPASIPPAVSSTPIPASRPTLANPFSDRGRITNPARFFDREDLLTDLFHSLKIGNHISLIGDNTVGKSSLLTQLQSLGPQRLGLPAASFLYIDLQLIDKEDEFYRALCRQLGISFCKGSALTEQISGRRLILCIDEIEKMAPGNRGRGFGHAVRTHLRGLAESNSRSLSLVTASKQSLDRLFDDEGGCRTSPLHNIFLCKSVPPFTPDTARAFLRARLEPTAIRFSPVEEEQLCNESRGNPGLLQVRAYERFEQRVSRL